MAAALTGALLGFFPSLVNRSGGPVGPEPGPPRVSAVPVDVPQNARLRLDGVPLAGHNLPAAALQEGSHRLEVETPCERAETILSPGEQLPALQLQPRRVRLPLASRPPGAAVWLDGAPAGLTTPAVLELPLCVTHEIELREEGHEPVRLRLEAGQDWQALTAAPLALSKTPEGRVFVPVAPYAVTVLHKGRPVGRAGQLLTLPQGPALLVLRNEDLFLERPVDVLVRGGQTTTLPIEFPAPGNLSVQAHPSNCEVSLNARSLGAPPILNLPVAAGTHEVRCRLLTTGEEKIQKIQISSGRNATCQFKF